MTGSLNVSGNTTFQGSSTHLSSLNVSGTTTLNNNATITGSLNVNSLSTFQGASTHLSSLFVSGSSYLQGFVGIGTSQICPLTITNLISNKIICMYDIANNNYQFTGFGTNSGLNLNIPSTTDNFRFLAGTSTTSSSEVVRISGNGDTTINGNLTITSTNTKKLIFDDQLQDIKLQLWSGYGFGINSGTLRYNTGTYHTFYNNSNQTMIIDNSANVCIGSSLPQARLDIYGNTLQWLLEVRMKQIVQYYI